MAESNRICVGFQGSAQAYCNDLVNRCNTGEYSFTGPTGRNYTAETTDQCIQMAVMSTATEVAVATDPAKEYRCLKQFEVNKSMTAVEEYLRCLEKEQPKMAREVKKKREARQKSEAGSRFLGKFGLRLGGEYMWNRLRFDDVYTRWNRAQPRVVRYDVVDDGRNSAGTPRSHFEKHDVRFLRTSPDNDADGERGRLGLRVALTTDPGYAIAKAPNPKVPVFLTQFTAFDFAIYGGDSDAPDKYTLRLLDGTLAIPFAERNFLEAGGALMLPDTTTWSNWLGNLRAGVISEIQGSPIGASERELTLDDAHSFSQSHTIVGFEVLYSIFDTKSGFTDPAGTVTYDGVDSRLEYLYSDYISPDELPDPGMGNCSTLVRPEIIDSHDEPICRSDIFATSGFNNIVLRAKVEGVQSIFGASFNYLLFADENPIMDKLVLGTDLSLDFHAGRAVDFFIGGRARQLWSVGDDNAPQLPDTSTEWIATVGTKLRFFEGFFGNDDNKKPKREKTDED